MGETLGIISFKGGSGGASLSGDNYRTVLGDKGTALLNGADLLAKLAEVAALTPFGNALSATNLVTLYVFAGYYDFSVTGITIPNFVNLVGVSTPKNTRLIGLINVSANTTGYSIRNLSVDNIEKTTSNSADFGVWDNLIINTSFTYKSTGYYGEYTKLNCLVDGVLNGFLVNAYVDNCTFRNNSCGHSLGHLAVESAVIENCTGLDNCFGYNNTSTGTLKTLNFTFKNCTGGNNCFGYYGAYNVAGSRTINSTFENCVASNNSFGCLFFNISGSDRSNITFNGKFINCTAGTNSFISRGNASSNSVLTFNGTMEGGTINADTKRNLTSTAKLKNVIHIGDISLIETGANLDKCKILGVINNGSAVTPTITRCDFNSVSPYGANVTNLITESEALNIKNVNIV